jgi:imidazolonepropionase-like amidohydrolase
MALRTVRCSSVLGGFMVLYACGAAVQARQMDSVALVNATIYPVAGDVIERGTLVVAEGRIVAVGRTEAVRVPDDAVVIDATRKVVMPGVVDTHSHIGIGPRPAVPAHGDTNESTAPLTPQLRAIDAIWPGDPGIRMAVAGGITTANIMPGSSNVIGGQTAYVKLRGNTIDEMSIDGAIGGMKMANGENPISSYGSRNQTPSTRMAVAALARQAFHGAQTYQAEKDAWDRKSTRERADSTPPKVDIGNEALLEVLRGERIVHHHTHRADDILAVVRLADEFGLRVVIQHGTEADRVSDILAARDIPVSLIVVDAPGGKHEAVNLSIESGGRLERAGVRVAIHSDDWVINSRFLIREAALAVRGGMSERAALEALTIRAAEMLDLGDRVGSLEPGKDADFVVLSGEPFALETRVLETWIEGEKVFDRSIPEHRRYATGGFGVQDRYPQLEVQP